MISVTDIMVGDFLQNSNGNVGKVIGVQPYNQAPSEIIMSYNGGTCFSGPKMLQPIPLTPEILEKSGWSLKDGIWIKYGPIRIGWRPHNKELIMGYHTLPMAVEFVHQLQNLIRDYGLTDDIKI